MLAQAHRLRAEFCVAVEGVVEVRPEGNANAEIPTGEIEVNATSLTVLGESAPLPFQLDEQAGEEARLKYRYLDLRREGGPGDAIRLRSKVNAAARSVLAGHDFVEIETPTLTRSTPEGARDFLVPARLQPGSFYALPQSPQLFKQLLMVAGMERYYQIARCYRDEDFRADRQPEFTQLDMEMSFVDADDVIAVSEEVLRAVWSTIGYDLPTPIPRISYADAMRPVRFRQTGSALRRRTRRVHRVLHGHPVPGVPGALRRCGRDARRGVAAAPDAGRLAGIRQTARAQGAGLCAHRRGRGTERAGRQEPVRRRTRRPGRSCRRQARGTACSSRPVRPRAPARCSGRRASRSPSDSNLIDPAAWAFTWVVDWPLFEPADEATASGDVAVGSGAWTAVHHAFTSPQPESEATFDTDPGSALANAYDIVCNGNEIGGGSIRIHRRDVQERVFAMMGIDHDEAQEKFGFLLEAFTFGAPPHGGIAFGWDRIVALLAGVDSIREVIAFPKSGGGVDPLTDAPAPITAQQRKESGIDFKPEKLDKP